MPSALRTQLLHWQMAKMSTIRKTSFTGYSRQPKKSAKQLSLVLQPECQVRDSEANNTRITLAQLYDAGITKQGMPIRVRLKCECKSEKTNLGSLGASERIATIILSHLRLVKCLPTVDFIFSRDIKSG